MNPKGVPYFVNHLTKTTAWSIPSTTVENSSAQLPSHIERMVDSQGRPYFANHKTRTTTRYNPIINDQDPLLPPHYERALDHEGREYYMNHDDHTCTWLNPIIEEKMKTEENKIVHQTTATGLDYWVNYASGGIYSKNATEEGVGTVCGRD